MNNKEYNKKVIHERELNFCNKMKNKENYLLTSTNVTLITFEVLDILVVGEDIELVVELKKEEFLRYRLYVPYKELKHLGENIYFFDITKTKFKKGGTQ